MAAEVAGAGVSLRHAHLGSERCNAKTRRERERVPERESRVDVEGMSEARMVCEKDGVCSTRSVSWWKYEAKGRSRKPTGQLGLGEGVMLGSVRIRVKIGLQLGVQGELEVALRLDCSWRSVGGRIGLEIAQIGLEIAWAWTMSSMTPPISEYGTPGLQIAIADCSPTPSGFR
eukprot:3615816-Rhodomonas_salina.1